MAVARMKHDLYVFTTIRQKWYNLNMTVARMKHNLYVLTTIRQKIV